MDWLPFDEEFSETVNMTEEEVKEVDYWEVNGNSIAVSEFTDALIEALCKQSVDGFGSPIKTTVASSTENHGCIMQVQFLQGVIVQTIVMTLNCSMNT